MNQSAITCKKFNLACRAFILQREINISSLRRRNVKNKSYLVIEMKFSFKWLHTPRGGPTDKKNEFLRENFSRKTLRLFHDSVHALNVVKKKKFRVVQFSDKPRFHLASDPIMCLKLFKGRENLLIDLGNLDIAPVHQRDHFSFCERDSIGTFNKYLGGIPHLLVSNTGVLLQQKRALKHRRNLT